MAGVVALDVGAQEIAALAPPGGAQLLSIQRELKGLRRDRPILFRLVDLHEAVGLAGLLFRRAELEQQSVARQLLSLEFA